MRAKVQGKRVDNQVFEGFFRFFKELDRRVKIAIAGSGIHNWGQELSLQYNQLYATDLGADYVELGSLNSIGAAVSSIVSVPMGWAAEKYSVKRVMLLGLACAILVATTYALAGNWWMLVPAIILASMAARIIFPLTDVIFITYTKTEQSGTVMGLSRTVWAAMSIFAPITAAVLVANFGGINAQGIRPLYYVQLVVAIFVFLFITVKLQTPSRRDDREKDEVGSKVASFIQDFRELFTGEEGLKRWIAVRSVRTFATNLSMPFIPLWMVDVKGADPYILGVLGTASTMMLLLLHVPAGRLADRIGRKRAFYLFCPANYLSVVLLIAAPSPEYLIIVGLLQGIARVSFVPFITMHWEMVPAEKRGRWFGMEGLMMISAIPATILGGILWQYGFMIEVLFLPILLEALVAIPILITVPDTLGRDN